MDRGRCGRYIGEMQSYPKIQLSRLREIGWKQWDPIGLAYSDGTWDDGCADEYDGYLLHVVSMLHRGEAFEEAVAYLNWASSENMGLGALTDSAAKASVATVDAIAAYLRTIPDGPLKVR